MSGTGQTEGGEKTQPFNRFHSRLFTGLSKRICAKLRESVSPNAARHSRPRQLVLGKTVPFFLRKSVVTIFIQHIQQKSRDSNAPTFMVFFQGTFYCENTLIL